MKGPHFYQGNNWILFKILKFWVNHIKKHSLYFQLLGWMGLKKMQLYYKNFLLLNCQCSYKWRILIKSKENRMHFKAELTPWIQFYQWNDSSHYRLFSLLKKRPSLLITIKMLHIFKFAASWPHYKLGI